MFRMLQLSAGCRGETAMTAPKRWTSVVAGVLLVPAAVWGQPVIQSVSHLLPNRCSGSNTTVCSTDANCPSGQICVSVLLTNSAGTGVKNGDAGNSGRIGSRVLWFFGDTFTNSALRSNTGAWGRRVDPRNLTEGVDGSNTAVQFVPYTADELAFNAAHANPPSCCLNHTGCSGNPYCNCPPATDCAQRYALWPGDVIELGDRSGFVYYTKLITGYASFDFRNQGMGIARFEDGSPTAVRDTDGSGNPVLIFQPPEPNFASGLVVNEPDQPYVYVYAGVNGGFCGIQVLSGRVPRSQAGDRTAYRFWDGTGWNPSLGAAVPVATTAANGLGSVAWNAYLGKYVAVMSGICTGGTNLHVRTAPRPEGPWSNAAVVDLGPLGAQTSAYYGLQHPELGDGRDLVISYFQGISLFAGQTRLVKLTFQ
jgi:Domain of unknown function (DUF4185)